MTNKFIPSFMVSLLGTNQPFYNLVTHYLFVSNTINQLKQIHTLLLKSPTKPNLRYHILVQLLKRLLQLPGDNLRYAHYLFDQIPKCRNQFLWTSLIHSHVLHDHFGQSITLYAKMHRVGVSPSGFTFSSVLNACARVPALFEGKQVHAMVVQYGFLGNKIVQTALLHMYAQCGLILDARDIFDRMDDKDLVAWTAMVRGYSKMGLMGEARWLFDNMEQRNAVSWTTMVAGYANNGDMETAKELYERMVEKDSVAWVAMIAGYGKCGNVLEAKIVFEEIQMADASCWAAMVACYAQNGYAKESIEMYKKMREEKVTVNEVAMVGAISACTQLGDNEVAATLAKHVEEGCCERTLFVSNALIHMHSKCGDIEQAWREFNKMSIRDVISYSALIAALADHGKAEDAMNLFSEMQKEGIRPNQVTFVGLLNACSHAGLIEEGCQYFELMTRVFGIQPLKEHYACMVDLLGRAGQLEKAYNLIIYNIGAADAKIWGSLLGACKVHGNTKLSEIAAMHLFKIEPHDAGNYALLANTYAEINKWDDAERVRKMMSERGMIKSPGCSWIEMLG
ncbi:hypothetical protein ACE6H2_009801 [Prunus campanulata]